MFPYFWIFILRLNLTFEMRRIFYSKFLHRFHPEPCTEDTGFVDPLKPAFIDFLTASVAYRATSEFVFNFSIKSTALVKFVFENRFMVGVVDQTFQFHIQRLFVHLCAPTSNPNTMRISLSDCGRISISIRLNYPIACHSMNRSGFSTNIEETFKKSFFYSKNGYRIIFICPLYSKPFAVWNLSRQYIL